MNGIVEKFGRVFLSKSVGNDGEPIYEQVRSASFSNLDLKWYDLTGGVHRQFKQFKGQKLFVGFNVKNTNKNGQLERYNGKLLMPLGLGELAAGPDLEYLNEVKRIEREIGEKLEFLDEDDEDEVKAFEKSRGIMAFFAPEEKPILQSPILAYLSMVVIMDDLLDSDGDGDINTMTTEMRNTKYSQMVRYATSNLKALRGENITGAMWKDMGVSSILQAPSMGLHAMLQFQRFYSGSIEISRCLRTEALKFVSDQEEAQPFFSAVADLYEAGALETSQEWNLKKDQAAFHKCCVELGKITCGIPVCCEGVALQLGIRLKPEIRSCFLFKWFCNEVACHSRKVNDLLSFNNEIIAGKATSNEVYALHVVDGLDLEDALKKINEQANLSVRSIIECGNLLTEMFDQDAHLVKYIKLAKGILCGYIQSCTFVPRYHLDMIWDCYVDVEENSNNDIDEN